MVVRQGSLSFIWILLREMAWIRRYCGPARIYRILYMEQRRPQWPAVEPVRGEGILSPRIGPCVPEGWPKCRTDQRFPALCYDFTKNIRTQWDLPSNSNTHAMNLYGNILWRRHFCLFHWIASVLLGCDGSGRQRTDEEGAAEQGGGGREADAAAGRAAQGRQEPRWGGGQEVRGGKRNKYFWTRVHTQ